MENNLILLAFMASVVIPSGLVVFLSYHHKKERDGLLNRVMARDYKELATFDYTSMIGKDRSDKTDSQGIVL